MVPDRTLVKEDLCQFPLAQNSLQFREAEEGDEHHKQEERERKNALQSATGKIGDTLLKRLMVIEADRSFFHDFENREHDTKQRGLQ